MIFFRPWQIVFTELWPGLFRSLLPHLLLERQTDLHLVVEGLFSFLLNYF